MMYHGRELLPSLAYDFVNQQRMKEISKLIDMGYDYSLSQALTHIDETSTEIVWHEEAGIIKGAICFDVKHIDKKAVLINFIFHNNKKDLESLFNFFETTMKNLGVIYLHQHVPIKHKEKIKLSEDLKFFKQSNILYKKV